MKKFILVLLLFVSFSACQTAENTNIENKNTNANYNQNSELQKIRNQLKQQSSHERNLNAAQNQTEQSNSNVENLTPRNSNKINQLHEKPHDIEPEKQ